MDHKKYPEIAPGSKLVKKTYAFVLLLLVGRGLEATARVDREVGQIFSRLPPGFTFCFGVAPAGPYMIVGKDSTGEVRYLGWRRLGRKIDLDISIKNLESALRIFTFRESTAQAYNFDRFSVDGNIPYSLWVVRMLDMVEVYLLPRPIASLAVKRYPGRSELSPLQKHVNRVRIYLRAFSPSLLRVIYRNL